MKFPVIGQFNISRSKEWCNQDTINWYAVFEQDGKTPQSLQPMPGILKLFDVNNLDLPIRQNGIYQYLDQYYVIVGSDFYTVQNNTASRVGDIFTQTGHISWTNNTTQIVFADGENYWVYTIATGVLAQVTTFSTSAPIPNGVVSVYFQDARVLFCVSDNSSVFYYSKQGEAQTFEDPLNFIAIESQPDTSVGISGSNERLFLFGHYNTEIWAPNTGANNQPYYRDNNFIYQFGIESLASLVKGAIQYDQPNSPVIDFTFWLTKHREGVGSFVMSMGGMPKKVSTPAVDLRLSQLTKTSDCYSVIYREGAHTFIECTFPTDDETFVFDVNTGWWFHKENLDGSRSVINSHIFFEGRHIVGSRNLPRLYTLSDEYLTNDGEEIRRARITETLIDENFKRISGNHFELDCESGQVANGITPYIFIYFSINGGRTWSNPFKIAMGLSGEYDWKTYIDGLGDGYSYTFKFETYDPVRSYVFGGSFDYTVST